MELAAAPYRSEEFGPARAGRLFEVDPGAGRRSVQVPLRTAGKQARHESCCIDGMIANRNPPVPELDLQRPRVVHAEVVAGLAKRRLESLRKGRVRTGRQDGDEENRHLTN